MNYFSLNRQHGLALPVMLILLAVMLLGSVYLMKASTSTTMMASNLAYDSAMSKAADLGLLRGSAWLTATAAGANRALLDADSAVNGYVSTYDPALPASSAAFWDGAASVVDGANNTIEYVIHRMCAATGPYDAPGPPANVCVQTTPNLSITGSGVAVGKSLASDAEEIGAPPQIHYVITARIFGPRGGNVVNQAVVMIGA